MSAATDEHSIPTDFQSAATLLRLLIAKRRLVKDALKERALVAAFDLIGRTAQIGEGTERLEAVSILGKAAEVSKPAAVLALPLLQGALQLPLKHTASWGTAEDRYYLAKAISAAREAWITSYAAVELASAEAAEQRSRDVWAEIAINRARSLADAVDTVARALADDRRTLAIKGDTASRKLNRIAHALMEVLPLADVPTGEGFGRALSSLVAEASDGDTSETRALRQETAVNILDLMIQMLRLRFPATLDRDVYGAVATIQGWWKPARPPEEINSRSERLARIAMDSLHALSRQGVADRNLRQALASCFGTELINRLGTEIAEQDPSLDPAISSWLSQGKDLGESKSNDAVRQIGERELDELAARLLLAIDDQEGEPQALDLIADDLELLEPGHAKAIRTASTRVRLVAQWARAISATRGLSLYGKRGDVVLYDPALHEAVDIQSSTRARIAAPGVVKQQEGRPARVVLKAQLQKL